MMRYIKALERKDIGLDTSMIPLGSCTMKLNAAAEMMPVTWEAFSRIHPFAPANQAAGYAEIFHDLEQALAEITGLPRSRCSRTPARRASWPACWSFARGTAAAARRVATWC